MGSSCEVTIEVIDGYGCLVRATERWTDREEGEDTHYALGFCVAENLDRVVGATMTLRVLAEAICTREATYKVDDEESRLADELAEASNRYLAFWKRRQTGSATEQPTTVPSTHAQ